MCAPQYDWASPAPATDRRTAGLGRDHRQSVAADLSTTLVQWQKQPDFSTDAGNSDLIVNNEISFVALQAHFRPARRRNQKQQ
jgi:hypothetical protein